MNKKSFLKYCFLLLLIVYLANIAFASELSLTQDDFLIASRNGVVSSMCFIHELITGTVSKIIMSLFVVGTGFMMITTGGFDPVKTLFPFCIAIALLYGGFELADVISGNRYNCKNLENYGDVENGVISNRGICSVSYIPQYSVGQVWKKCVSSGGNGSSYTCETIVNSTVEIAVNDVVILDQCEDGSYRSLSADRNLRYKCMLEGELGRFEILAEDRNNIDVCKKYCSPKTVANFFTASETNLATIRAISTDNSVLSNVTTTNVPRIKVLSGELVSGANKGLKEASVIAIKCTDGALEYDQNGNVRSVENSGQVKAKCNGGIISVIDGSCKLGCKISSLASNKYTSQWKSCGRLNELSIVTNTPCIILQNNESVANSIVESGRILQTNACVEGAGVSNNAKRSVFKCDNGVWSYVAAFDTLNNAYVERSEDPNTDKNTSCEKPCSLPLLSMSHHVSDFTAKTKTSSSFSSVALNALFYKNDLVSISSCTEGYKLKTENRCGTTVPRPREFLCFDGNWTEIDNKKETCRLYCDNNDLDTLRTQQHVKEWTLFSDVSANSVCNNAKYTVSAGGFVPENAIIYPDEYIRGTGCEEGYGIIDVNTLPYFKCNGTTGNLDLVGANGNSCKRTCGITALNSDVANVSSWKKCGSDGANCVEIVGVAGVFPTFNYGEIAAVSVCATGYSINDMTPSKYRCRADGQWEMFESGGTCGANCAISTLEKTVNNNSTISVTGVITSSSVLHTTWKKCNSIGSCIEDVAIGDKMAFGTVIAVDSCVSAYSALTSSIFVKAKYKCSVGNVWEETTQNGATCQPYCTSSGIVFGTTLSLNTDSGVASKWKTCNSAEISSCIGTEAASNNLKASYGEIIEISECPAGKTILSVNRRRYQCGDKNTWTRISPSTYNAICSAQ
jgi:type IV secretory pathway VirB2 component (pilin)